MAALATLGILVALLVAAFFAGERLRARRQRREVDDARARAAGEVKAADERRDEARKQGALAFANEWLRRRR